jgi:predicted ABC-type ATPase
MFAGPNGSGKSTLIRKLQSVVLRPDMLGVYINPDNIEQELREEGSLDFARFRIPPATASGIIPFLASSPFLQTRNLAGIAQKIKISNGRLLHPAEPPPNSYLASVIADFIRITLLTQRASFSFETVMSSPDKIALLTRARSLGYRVYLYYVATEDSAINISRVNNRMRLGGHPVPEGKIIARYQRSLGLLGQAIRQTDRAYIFDNSRDEQEHTWIAEVTDANKLEIKTDQIPAWFAHAVPDTSSSPQAPR